MNSPDLVTLMQQPQRPAAPSPVARGVDVEPSGRGRVRKTFRIMDGEQSRLVTLVGRTAWALGALVHAGAAGCTPITTPGPRWSDYVFKLRRLGFDVETIDEQHGGPYAGTHARYVLRQCVEFADEGEAT